MIPVAFEYAAPGSVEEAVSILREHGDDAKILAGGHSLLPLMKLRLAVPMMLVDLGGIREVRYIRDEGAYIAIGAMTTYAELEQSATVRSRLPMLAAATSLVGDVQVRHRGTLGGAMAHADPAGDMPAVVSAIGGSAVLTGPDGTREVDISEFFLDIFTSALRPDEVLTEVRLRTQDGSVGQYEKFRRREIDWAIVGAAVNVVLDRDSISDARVVLTNVGPTPMHAMAAENALRGGAVEQATIVAASDVAADGIVPSSELAGSSEYKKHLVRVLTRRALEAAIRRAQGERSRG
jgi:aerobic carbon-monoxide dehydrogenase medium subunit